MKKIAFIILTLCLFASCSKESEEPVEVNTFDAVLGRWEQVSYLSSGGYFVSQKDGSYYEFKTDKTFVKYTGTILNETKTGTFEYTPQNKSIRCNFVGGWYEVIEVSFTDSNIAEFHIITNTGSSTIKVSRSNGSKNY